MDKNLDWDDIPGQTQTTTQSPAVKPLTKEEVELRDLMERVKSTKFSMKQKVELPEPALVFYQDGREMTLATKGMMGVFTGAHKSGKSFVLASIISSHLSGGTEVLNFSLKLPRKLIWIDTEQSNYFFHMTQQRIYHMAGLNDDVDRYEAYHLRKFSAKQRFLAIKSIINENENVLDGLIIDGIVDLMTDYNDLAESRLYMDELMAWTEDRGILLLGVLHVNKGDGKLRGHLGTEVQNKFDFGIKVIQPKRNTYLIENTFGRFPTFANFEFSRRENDEGGFGQPEYLSGRVKQSLII